MWRSHPIFSPHSWNEVTTNMSYSNYTRLSPPFQDPQTAIPKGTLSAIFVSTVVYMLVACVLGAVIRRDANGFEPPSVVGVVEGMLNSTVPTSLGSNSSSTISYSMTTDVSIVTSMDSSTFHVPYINATEYVFSRENVANCSLVEGGCQFGLFNDYQVIFRAGAEVHATHISLFFFVCFVWNLPLLHWVFQV